MKQLKVEPHLSVAEIRKRMRKTKTKDEYLRWQCIYLVSTMNGVAADYLGKILGVSKSLVYSYVQTYNKLGAEKFISNGKKSICLVLKVNKDINNRYDPKVN